MNDGYGCDVVLFEDFSQFLGVCSGVVEFGASDDDSFSRHKFVVEVFEGNGAQSAASSRFAFSKNGAFTRDKV